MDLRQPLSALGLQHPDFSMPQTRPSGGGEKGHGYLVVRQPQRRRIRQLLFCRQFYEGNGTSACNLEAPSLRRASRPRV